ncbi:hypothetical protein Tco_0794665 [Tanacetum coccineum]
MGGGVGGDAKTRQNAFLEVTFQSRRPFYQQTTLKNRNLNDKVNTAKINSINTAKGNRVTNAVGEHRINAVKSSTCWVWRPKINVLDHVSKNSRSYISKQFGYVDPTGRLNITWCSFLQKPTGSEEFHQIVDFIASRISVNDGEQQLSVIVDGQTIAITEDF